MKRGIITIDTNGTVIIPTTPVWMTLSEIADMFGVYPYDVRKIMRGIFKHRELAEAETQRYIKLDNKVSFDAYSLELIVAIAFRINSRESQVFRRFCYRQIAGCGYPFVHVRLAFFGRLEDTTDFPS